AQASIMVYPGAYAEFDHPSKPIQVLHGLAFTADGSGRAHSGTNPAARPDAMKRVPEWFSRTADRSGRSTAHRKEIRRRSSVDCLRECGRRERGDDQRHDGEFDGVIGVVVARLEAFADLGNRVNPAEEPVDRACSFALDVVGRRALDDVVAHPPV